MTFRWRTLLGLAALGAASACGDSSPTNENPPLTDEGTSCSDAVAMASQTNAPGGTLYVGSGVIDGSADVDFFSFPVAEGEWIQIVGRANPSGGGLDSEITLYDASGATQLAYNDDSVVEGGLDSTLPYLPTTTGSACVSIADFEGRDAQLGYQILALPIDFDLYDEFNLDTEPNDSPGSAQIGLSAFGTGANVSTKVLGAFDDASDVDVFRWAAPAAAVATEVTMTPSFGPDGYGSTTEVGMVELYEPGGGQVYARLDPSTGAERIHAPVIAGNTYYVAVHPPAAGASGDDPFYVLPLGMSDVQNDQESDDVSNDDSASPEMPPGSPSGSGTISYYVAGTLPSPGDTDWWQINVASGKEIALFCASWRIGSGVRDATFSIYDDPGAAPLQSEQEVEDADVAWSSGVAGASMGSVTTAQSGPHYLRVDATAYDAEVSGTYYQCGMHVLG